MFVPVLEALQIGRRGPGRPRGRPGPPPRQASSERESARRHDHRLGRQLAGREFAPHRLANTLRDLAGARQHETARADEDKETARKIAECDRKLAQYRAALDAGASPAIVATWIAETEAEKASHALAMRCEPVRPAAAASWGMCVGACPGGT